MTTNNIKTELWRIAKPYIHMFVVFVIVLSVLTIADGIWRAFQ